MSKFPHLTQNGNESDFPDIDTVQVYQYDNEYDYSKFDHAQMRLILCKVPWDMGEAHIGARTISGIGNVVYFDSARDRDEWFDNLDDEECFRFQTKYRALHRDNQIILPIPYDVAARFNYLAVYYEPMPNEENPIMYEVPGGIRGWFWFVREVEFLSPNSTRLHLLNDAWQTFIYDIEIPYMMLERGHAPMNETSVKKYLADPIANCAGLLADDVNYGEAPRIAVSSHEHVINGGNLSNMFAVIVTNSTPSGSWGTKAGGNWKVPAQQAYGQGVPTSFAFALKATELSSFLSNVQTAVPQFAQTVQAVFFANANIIDITGSFTFCSHMCYTVSSSYTSVTVHDIEKSDFKYNAKYSEIAKLYTYPYAAIVLTDQDGTQTEIRIEDTHGTIQLDYCASLAFPFLKIRGEVSNVGKLGRKSISFHNASTRTMPIGGNWYDLLYEWQIPTFAVLQEASTHNDYATHFDRVQEAYAADNAKTSGDASADTAKDNADANADNVTDNAQVTMDGNDAAVAISNAGAVADTGFTNTLVDGQCIVSNFIINRSTASTIAANQKQAAIGAVTSVASGAVGASASGHPVGAAASLASGVIGAAGQVASMEVANGLEAADANNTEIQNSAMSTANQTTNSNKTTNQTDVQSDLTDNTNDVIEAHAANDSVTMKANATRTQTTEKANNARTRDTVAHAISNQLSQAALEPAQVFGSMTNGDGAITKPLALFSTIVTQDDYAIARAGDEFLRYGYFYNRQYEFDGNWCKMPRFTYWKVSDFWVRGLQVPDMYVDKIRFFLFGGVTVWKAPEDIGNYSIYENV